MYMHITGTMTYYYNIIAKVVVKKGGEKASSDQFSHTSPLDHTIQDVFSLLRGGKYASMAGHMTCYAGTAPCSFVPSHMTEITVPSSFPVSDLSAFGYKALLFDANLPAETKKAPQPQLTAWDKIMSRPQPKLPQKFIDPNEAADVIPIVESHA
jgi:hypothetical protein